MSDIKIYHNPRCSKSRETLALIESRGIKPDVIEYLKDPLAITDLEALCKYLGKRPKDILRTKESIFAALKLDVENDQKVLAALHKNPILLERPIVVRGKKAAIGRPPENVLPLLKT